MRPDVRTRAGAALALAAVSLAVAGCGSSAVTKKDYIARANAICSTAVRDVRNVTPPSTTGGASLPELGRYLEGVSPIVAAEAKQLRAIPHPKADRALLARYLTAVGATASQYRALADAARAHDRQAMNAATAALLANPAAGLARRYGLADCAGAAATVKTS